MIFGIEGNDHIRMGATIRFLVQVVRIVRVTAQHQAATPVALEVGLIVQVVSKLLMC